MARATWLCMALLWLGLGTAQADWAGFSRFGALAEVAVEADAVRVNLRVAETAAPTGVAVPEATPTAVPPWLVGLMPLLLRDNGQPLAGRLLSLAKVDAGGGAAGAYYEAVFSYPLDGRVARLSIAPPTGADRPIGLVMLHRTVPVSDLVPLEKPVKLALDWNDPWRSRFDDPTFARRHAEPRSYLYVEPYEVRHEMLLRLADLKPWLDLGLKDPRHVEDGEREALRQKLGAFLLARNPLRIDGATPAPQLDRVEFVHFSRAGVVPDEPGRLDTDTALVGVVLAYLTENPAQTLQLDWDLFGADTTPRLLSIIQGQESFDGYMTPKQPRFEWSQQESLGDGAKPLAQPADAPPLRIETAPTESMAQRAMVLAVFTLSLVLLLFFPQMLHGMRLSVWLLALLALAASAAFRPWATAWAGAAPQAPGLDEAHAKALLQSLLHNAYRAFQQRDEEKAYDRLAKSLDGAWLEQIYLQQRQAILRQAQGLGGAGKVDRVEVLESRPQPLDGAAWRIDARWMAHGTVSHWGHAHERHNLYQAKIDVRPAGNGVWKIVGMAFLDGQRLEPGAQGWL